MKIGTLKARLSKRAPYDMSATLHDTRWYIDGSIAVKLPDAVFNKFHIPDPKPPYRIFNLEDLLTKYEGYKLVPAVRNDFSELFYSLGKIGVHDPKMVKKKLCVELCGFDKNKYVKCQIDWATSLFPGIKWFRVSRGIHPLVGKFRNKIVALILPVVDEDSND